MKKLKRWELAIASLLVSLLGTTFIYEGLKLYVPNWNPVMSIFIGIIILLAGAVIGLKVLK